MHREGARARGRRRRSVRFSPTLVAERDRIELIKLSVFPPNKILGETAQGLIKVCVGVRLG
jgi:hypothetical protein